MKDRDKYYLVLVSGSEDNRRLFELYRFDNLDKAEEVKETMDREFPSCEHEIIKFV